MLEPMKTEHAECRYDAETRIAYFTWTGTVTSKETAACYEWMAKLLDSVADDQPVRGSIIDFTGVQQFEQSNLRTARSEAKQLRTEKTNEVKQLPTALVVETLLQEMFLSTSMRLTETAKEENPRVVMVKSHEEGLEHINKWHRHTEKNKAQGT